MSRRTPGILATFALIVAGLVALGASTAPPALGAEPVVPYCSAPAAPPCIVRLTRAAVDVDPNLYRVVWNEKAPSSGFYSWYFETFTGGAWRADMSADGTDETTQVFKLVLDFGSFNPVTYAGQGSSDFENPVYRSVVDGHYRISITASPINRLTGCDFNVDPPSCPTYGTADDDVEGYLDGVVNDARWFGETAAEHRIIGGFSDLHNTEYTGGPPVIVTDPVTGSSTMTFTLRNTHAYADHTTVFHGNQQLRLPNSMLREVYGIPDPDTMSPGSLATSLGGSGTGTITVHPEADHTGVVVYVTGVTFSTRTVRIKRGIIVPLAPTHLSSWRISAASGRIYFTKATPRGSRVTSYLARCQHGSSVKTANGYSTGVTFSNLARNTSYSCRVRARSKAGYGPWSALVHLNSAP
ncbi:fibronectin type III domain-containing protein [Nocardioides marmorisolisilvae]|nr:fibronectin type III domain-containing protein [Nocardioides marmorisolisilvae]